MIGSPTRRVRCAIYTRKSSEEGLEQGFNSLDAQREACAAYILSQAGEGWALSPERYDDGGVSGGTLERPALQRLLADVAAGRIDTVVVYKVDRLSRSLLDFAKLVERFEEAGTSFLSVTQAFNTTSSMGRLTLNMLLSFAQFEREVTAERIRDKIAASKARGMWMGGVPPLGYRPDGRSLAVVEDQAALVRTIFQRYLEAGTVRRLADALDRERLHAPVRTLASGRTIGGRAFTRGQLYLMLNCRTYRGEVQHKEQVYPGLHPAIVDRALWAAVQARLAAQTRGERRGGRGAASLLAGRIVDAAGAPLIAAHTAKPGRTGGQVRYRYYVTSERHHGESDQGLRLPARAIEPLVAERLAAMFDDPLALIAAAGLSVGPERLEQLDRRCRELALRLRQREPAAVAALLEQVRVGEDSVTVCCTTAAVAAALDVALDHGAPATLALTADVRLRRSGLAMRLIDARGAAPARPPDAALVRLLVQARGWWAELRRGALDVTGLAQRERRSASYVTRVVRLAFLSPAVTDAILAGRQRAGIDTAQLTLKLPWPGDWMEQARLILPDAPQRERAAPVSAPRGGSSLSMG